VSSRSVPAFDSGPLADIAALVQESAGLVVDVSRREVLAGLVQDRVARLGFVGPEAYFEFLTRDPAERQTLIEGLTIGETYFARIPPQIRALEELVLPALLARSEGRIRIWSAGCSTGEEPYTLALLLAKLLPAAKRAVDVRIIGTDINSRALATAREGRYGARSVSLLPEQDLERFFIPDGNGWRVSDELRDLVEFRQHNLATDPAPAQQLDLILCRNVLIYFDRPKMLEIVDAMHRTLTPGGWLLLGHSETLWRLYDGFSLVRHDDAFLYRREEPEPRPKGRSVGRRAIPRRVPIPAPITLPAPAPTPSRDVRPEIREALAAGACAMATDLAAAHLEREPLDAEVHYLHGLALVESGEDAPALVALRRAAYLDPTAGFAQFLLGVVLGRLGHGAEAARAYGAAAASLSRRKPDERVVELGGRRVEDLAAMCRQLAGAPHNPVWAAAAPPAVSSR
jgi:chemotaxis protein methyltransferase CheR